MTEELAERLSGATGGDAGLDAAIAAAYGLAPARFTESVEAARGLVAAVLPGWKLHVGFGVSGVFPYAALTRDDAHVEAEAPTVPLAILRVAVRAAKPSPVPSPEPPAPPAA